MAWLAVDKSGEEYIFVENKPERMETIQQMTMSGFQNTNQTNGQNFLKELSKNL